MPQLPQLYQLPKLWIWKNDLKKVQRLHVEKSMTKVQKSVNDKVLGTPLCASCVSCAEYSRLSFLYMFYKYIHI